LKTTIQLVDQTTVKLSVEVPFEDLAPAIESAYRKVAKEVRIPGFRKGHVPPAILDARVGRMYVLGEAVEEAVPAFFLEAVREKKLEPVGRPKFELGEVADGEPLKFDATVEVKPEIDLPEYAGLEVEAPDATVSDGEVDEQLGRLRDAFAQLEVISRPLAEGDYAQIDIRGYRNAEQAEDINAPDYLYEVGSGQIVPELDAELAGKRKGDILKFNATLPETAGGPLAGQEITFHVLVKEAKAKALPDLDDEFAKQSSEFETLVELREEIRSRVGMMKQAEATAAVRGKVLDALLERAQVPLPEAMVLSELRFRADRLGDRLQRLGMPFEAYLERAQTTHEKIQDDLRSQAEYSVKAQLVLDVVAKTESIEVTDQDMDAELERQASRSGGRTAADLRASLAKAGGIGILQADIIRTKALDLLVERANVKEPEGQKT